MSTPRTLLPLLDKGPHGSRSAMTCHFRCADACAKPMPNQSDNTEFHEVAKSAFARRSVLKAGGVGAGALVIANLQPSMAAAAVAAPRRGGVAGADFTSVPPNANDQVTVPQGYVAEVLISWGDPVTAKAPRFDVDNQTPEAQAQQFGYNNDYVGLVEINKNRSYLVCNHEYTNEELMFPTGAYDTATIKKIAMAAHGMSVVELERGRKPGSWKVRDVRKSRGNRRIHTGTKFRIDGPAAGDDRLKTSADPSGRVAYGTLNNCAGGNTPWGTVLSGEENFNQYFDASGELDSRYADSYARIGITGEDTRGWSEVEDRFDLTKEPHEPFRFGWIVEVDPHDPKSQPRKHTMLGRFKHEGANIAVAEDGRVVAYMGDDERGDYIYKFVSERKMNRRRGTSARLENMKLLTQGTLYVAKFTGDGADDGVHDGTGEWIALTSDKKSFVPGMSVADVLIDTRLAADKMSPTRMDRPEDIQPNPVNGKVYCALTNNSARGNTFPTDAANPLDSSMVRASLDAELTSASGNRNGYVLEISPTGGHTSTEFSWDLMLVCGDPEAPETYFAGYPKQLVSSISCPDNVAFDSAGNLWISTDGNVLGAHDGLFRVPVDGPKRGEVKQFLSVPTAAETCGPLITDDGQSVFCAVQHPGESDGATFENQTSTWPSGNRFPQPSVVVTRRASR